MNDESNLNQEELLYQKELLGSGSFAITARVAMQLGRESISNSITAIIELVKNAYDADAENVQIIFSGLNTDQPLLIIDDDGNGMDLQQLRSSWLVIGTDNKLISQKSKQKKRVLIGEKGLGRLGLDRLCESTQVQTFTEDESKGVELNIDWKKYERTNAKLDSIEHNIYRISKTVPDFISGNTFFKRKGTRLILNGLKDIWGETDLKTLQTELSLLVSPFAGINDFKIIFFTDTLNISAIVITSEELLEAAEWKVTADLDIKEGQAFITSKMVSRNAEIDLSTTWAKAIPEEKYRVPECGSVKFEFYYIPRKDIPALSLKKAQVEKFMNNNQGIRIYRDGFRVMPYGKPNGEGDWLSLAARRVQQPAPIRASAIGSWKIGFNQSIGAVFITREANPYLLDITNREGIVEGTAFHDLRKFALHCVGSFERELQRYEQAQGPEINDDFEKTRIEAEEATKASTEKVEQFKNRIDSIVETLTVVTEEDTNADSDQNLLNHRASIREIPGAVSEVVNELSKIVIEQQERQEHLIQAADKREEDREEEFQKQKDTLGNLASLGILATTFGHETVAASNLVLNNSKELKSLSGQFRTGEFFYLDPEEKMQLNGSIESIEYGAQRIDTFANFTLRNVIRDKRRRIKVFLDELIKRVFRTFYEALEQERGIKIIIDLPDQVSPINAFYIDWESILINFITNSVWALENTPKNDRIIRVKLQNEESILHLSFADSGFGIAAGYEKDIFLPTISTKKSRSGDIVGTGMGLAIVHNFVSSYNGSVYVESPCDIGGAEFHIKIPLAE